ncbi:hypothetical protein [Jeotgalibacillus sp. R-1-5s-1]|uniref:hypothetical protein n=1 Tax=Jeotgalibacillus sp. R-1-5s-1 TaxID=2555897 RepID=UPI00106DC3F9|nr:hypothetical protein [Jeotgalibacillus sp. R-1-5s-1]TFE01817.1 hypothetical protein E2491_03315 [Jeotgalibacillus sp. R-1-5s-1]
MLFFLCVLIAVGLALMVFIFPKVEESMRSFMGGGFSGMGNPSDQYIKCPHCGKAVRRTTGDAYCSPCRKYF